MKIFAAEPVDGDANGRTRHAVERKLEKFRRALTLGAGFCFV